MAVARVEVAADLFDIDADHPGRVRPVDHGEDPPGLRQLADLLHGQDEAGGRGDVTAVDHARPRGDPLLDQLHDLLRALRRRWNGDPADHQVPVPGHVIPGVVHRSVFLVCGQDLVPGRQAPDAAGENVHAIGQVRDHRGVLRVGPDERGQLGLDDFLQAVGKLTEPWGSSASLS